MAPTTIPATAPAGGSTITHIWTVAEQIMADPLLPHPADPITKTPLRNTATSPAGMSNNKPSVSRAFFAVSTMAEQLTGHMHADA
ncbi:hypothetical protein [Kibdelosporangium aridum]|uniref:hypothetical protein n=1 Tax=Kibdelosporangium aridum TaxID=2030 RepID=UPI0035F0AB8E